MNQIVRAESKLTDRYQTTVPDIVRKTLGLQKRDKICYVIQDDGTVVITRSTINDDPILAKFLQFLAEDMEQNPQSIQAIDNSKIERIQSLVSDMDVDLDAPLTDEEE